MKTKYPLAQALPIAEWLLAQLQPATLRIAIAGSLRRQKPDVGDIEILYIPRFQYLPDPADLFSPPRRVNLADRLLTQLLSLNLIAARPNKLGHLTWGPKNKLARHLDSVIPIDFFATTEDSWHNYLVCRTGGKHNNIAIATAARRQGWRWHPYAQGFTDEHGRPILVHSEQEVFALVNLPYLEPQNRP